MAVKDFLSKGTYTSIENLIYEKSLKRCTVVLEIWSDSSKSTVLANKGITVDGSYKVISVESIKNKLKSQPHEISADMHYIIDKDGLGSELSGYENQLTKYNEDTNQWDNWVLWEGLVIFVEDEQKYYRYKNKEWVEEKNVLTDKRIWDKWFAPEVALAEGTNPTKQMYKFIKTLEQFKDCVDA